MAEARRGLVVDMLVFAAIFVAVGCGGDSDDTVEQPDHSIIFETEEFEVPPGDYFECFFTDIITDRELSVYGARGHQGPGGHHILAYYTDILREPGHHACREEEMVTLNQIAGSGGSDRDEVLGLKENLAIRVPAGVQLVLEAHYINTTGAPYTVTDGVELKLLDPEEVSAYVGHYVTVDDTFEVPPMGQHTSTSYCEVERDFDVVLSLGHLHELGTRYLLEAVDEEENVVQTLRDDTWRPEYTSHPPIDYFSMAEPLKLTKGMRLHQTCEWENTETYPLVFPREMCLGFFYFFPGDERVVCDMKPTLP